MTNVQAGSTAINVEGNVTGTIFNGDHNLLVNENHGTIVVNQYAQKPPRAQRRNFLPKPPRKPTLVGRQVELTQIEGWLASNRAVLLYGADGLGKTTLAKMAANGPAVTSLADGVVFIEGVDKQGKLLSLNDITQRLFDTYFESDPPLKVDPTTADLYLNNVRALVILNSIFLTEGDLKDLLDLFPDSPILVATEVGPFAEEFETLEMPPLSREEALTLLGDRSRLVLSEETRPNLEVLADLLDEVPAALVMAANALLQKRTTLPALLDGLRGIAPKSADPIGAALERVYTLLWDTLSPDEQQMLLQVAAAPGVSVSRPWLEQVAGGKAVSTSLESLEMLQANSPRLRLMPGMLSMLLERDGIESARLRLLDEMLTSAKERWRDFDFMAEELGNLLGLFDWCVSQKRWSDTVALGRALDPFLTLRGLWDAWRRVLTSLLEAARATKDAALEGWTPHQLGTHHFITGDPASARDLLQQARDLRLKLDDKVGLAYTQYNLDMLGGGAPTSAKSNAAFLPWLIGGLITVAVAAGVLLSGAFRSTPPPEPTAIPTPAIPSATLIVPPTATPIPFTEAFTPPPAKPTDTTTPLPSDTSTPAPTATFAIMTAVVSREDGAYCFYGPGRFYLALTGLNYKATDIQVTGRARDLNWVYVNFPGVKRGDVTHCWIQANELTLSGPFESLEVVYPDGSYKLPPAIWPPVKNVEASRSGDTVTVTWESSIPDLALGDRESETSARYLVEAWLCKGGVVTFTPLPVYPYRGYIQLHDETGCTEPSRARVLFAEKHGYATPVDVPWSPHP